MSVQSVGVGGLRQRSVPYVVGGRRQESPSVVGGQLLHIRVPIVESVQSVGVGGLRQRGVPNVVGGCRQQSPSIVGSKLLCRGIPIGENGSKAAVVGEFLQFFRRSGKLSPSIVERQLLGGCIPTWSLIEAWQREASNGRSGLVGVGVLRRACRRNQSGDAVSLSGRRIRHCRGCKEKAESGGVLE